MLHLQSAYIRHVRYEGPLMSKTFQNIAFALLLALMLGVTSGLIGGL